MFNFEGPALGRVGREKLNRSRIERNGGIAQLGEHLLCKQGVSGSIPLISTNEKRRGPEPFNNDGGKR